MKKKRNIRDLIYVNGKEMDNNCFYSYGIEFNEFMSSVNNRPGNLILLKHKFDYAKWNFHTSFEYVTSKEINELIDDDVHGYGDFCWVDFDKEADLDRLTKVQIAELLFFGHQAKPLNQIPKLRFAYYAHDDGWFNKLYVTRLEDYEVMLSRAIALKVHKLTGRSICDIPGEISRILLQSTKEGLFIDFAKIVNSKLEIKVPISAVGLYTDMDKVYDFRDEITDYRIWLVFSKKSWRLVQEG